MLLVVGGAASGKRRYVESLGYKPEEMADGVLDARPVLFNLQDLVAQDPAGCDRILPILLEKKVVVCCEVGSGVIPAHRQEREAREAAGRLCIALAERAERVIRLVAGIPIVIKG